MVWRENYYTCKEYKIEIALQWNPDFSNNLTWESKFVLSIGTFKDRGKITVFGWRREVKFPSKYREFQNTDSPRNWGSTVLYRSLWTTIKRDGLKNPTLAQQEVACTGHRISCRLFVKGSRLTHELQCPVLEDEILINGLLEGMIYHVYHVKTSTDAKKSALF